MEISLNCERFGDECLERLCGFLCHAAFNVAYGRESRVHKFCILYLGLKPFFHSLYESKFHMASLNVQKLLYQNPQLILKMWELFLDWIDCVWNDPALKSW